jgi:hypothetical protein
VKFDLKVFGIAMTAAAVVAGGVRLLTGWSFWWIFALVIVSMLVNGYIATNLKDDG